MSINHKNHTVSIAPQFRMDFDNSFGSLWTNHSKSKSSHPDLKGQARLPSGDLVEVSAWSRVSASGKPYLSLSILTVIDEADSEHEAYHRALTGLLPQGGK